MQVGANNCKGVHMADGNITIRTDKELIDKISALAKSMDRSRNWVIEDALASYIDLQEWQIRKIKKSMQQAREGKLIPIEEVFAELDKKIENKMKELNKKKH